jgi:hypothetical protein
MNESTASSSSAAHTPSHWLLRFPLFAFIAILVVLYTTFVISTSQSIGRLSNDSTYDDVDYFNMGFPLYRAFQDKGLPGLLRSYYANPPRSMYGGCASALGFTLFGVHDWSPYATNAIVLAVFLGYGVYLFRDRPRWLLAGVFVYILSSPLAAIIIHDFKPDAFNGILIVIGCLTALADSTVREGHVWRRFFWAGVFFGLAVLAKSTVFPFVYGMAGIAFVLGAFLAIRFDGCKGGLSQIAKLAAALSTPVLLLSSLQFIPGGKPLLLYIKENSFGKGSSVWSTHINVVSAKDRLRYYIAGPGSAALDSIKWVCLALFVLAVVLAVRSKDARKRVLTVCAVALAMVTYVFVSLNPTKNAFLGIPAQAFFILLPLFLLATLLDFPERKRFPVEAILAALIMSSSLFLFIPAKPLGKSFWYWDGDGPKRKKINTALVGAILNDTPREAGPRRVLVATTGFVSFTTIQWLLNKEGRDIGVEGIFEFTTPSEALHLAANADYVITGETGAEGQYTWFPSNKDGSYLDAAIAATPGMHRLAAAASRTGPQFRVYRNEQQQARHSFSGWRNPEGLIMFQNTKYLFGMGRTPSVEFECIDSREYLITLDAFLKTKAPAHLTVLANGQKIGELDLHVADESKGQIRFKAQPGRNVVRLEPSAFEEHPSKDGKVWTVTFSQLAIWPAEPGTPP